MATDKSQAHDRVALVLQGGGALGAYQAGVYQAMQEHECTPNWVAGTSIGAINAALIAGNLPEKRLERLKAFWQGVSTAQPWRVDAGSDSLRRVGGFYSAMRAVATGQQGFFRPRFNPPWSRSAETASFYDTAPLGETLSRLIDFDLLNDGPVRLSVGAVSVTRGELVYFDSRHERLGPEHIMASGALPPGFPAVRVGDEAYWDGGIFSNTPLETVLNDSPRTNTLCFAVNLWNSDGPEPKTLMDVFAREKEIRYASRFKQQVENYRDLHDMRRMIRALYAALPEDVQARPEFKRLSEFGCHTTMSIVRLGRAAQGWELAIKDVNFSRIALTQRWDAGYDDASRMCEDKPWGDTLPSDVGVLVHELPRARWRIQD